MGVVVQQLNTSQRMITPQDTKQLNIKCKHHQVCTITQFPSSRPITLLMLMVFHFFGPDLLACVCSGILWNYLPLSYLQHLKHSIAIEQLNKYNFQHGFTVSKIQKSLTAANSDSSKSNATWRFTHRSFCPAFSFLLCLN